MSEAGTPSRPRCASSSGVARVESARQLQVQTQQGLINLLALSRDISRQRRFVWLDCSRESLWQRLPSPELKQQFIDRVTQLAGGEDPPYTLDYWRLNMSARKSETLKSGIRNLKSEI